MSCCSDGDHRERAVEPPPAAPPGPSRRGSMWRRIARRIAGTVEWVLPVTTLAMIPKCPACVAADIFLFTGIGLSFPAATAVRWSLIAVSCAALAYLLFRASRRAITHTGIAGAVALPPWPHRLRR